MTLTRPVVAASTLAALIMTTLAFAESMQSANEVGTVEKLQNEATATSNTADRRLSEGDAIRFADTVSTGPEARAELGFVDGTALTLGENASLVVDAFVFDPEAQSSLSASVQGAFRFVTGQLASVTDKTVTIRTPLATIGVRGTDFWGGPIDGNYGVFLIDGEVTVTTEGGEVTLDEPGTGTTLTGSADTPGAVIAWPQEKVDRAFATVTFQ